MQNFKRATPGRREPQVKILTYNIWFNETVPERLDAVLKIIEDEDADFVCLQEMTHEIWRYFMGNTYIQSVLRSGGSFSPNQFGSYGTVMLSKYPCRYYQCEFESLMGRSLILAEPYLPVHLIVATSHFESLNQAPLRCKQLETTFSVLKAAQGDEFAAHSVLVGDFNFQGLNPEQRRQFF